MGLGDLGIWGYINLLIYRYIRMSVRGSRSENEEFVMVPNYKGMDQSDMDAMEHTRRAEEAGRKIIEDNLKIYLKRIGNDKELKPSFIGWIAHLHPENVKLDTRLDPEIAPHNPHKVIYDHIYKEHFKNIGKPWFGRGVMKKKTRKGRKKVSKKGISYRHVDEKKRKKTRKRKHKRKTTNTVPKCHSSQHELQMKFRKFLKSIQLS